MPAIITDQIRVLNASNFVSGIGNANNSYYVFIGLPNATEVATDWNTSTPDPVDNFDQHDNIYDTLISAKKINTTDVLRVIKKITWTSGTIYEMYRHDYSVTNLTPQTSASNLYNANYYVMNSDFRVYECIYNGGAPSNSGKGIVSLDEPVHTDLEPRLESDGYLWKYLYTIAPADIVKFTTEKYMPVPPNWGDVNTAAVKDAAVRGHVETVIIKNRGTGYTAGTTTDIDILGDGTGGKVSITVTDQEVSAIEVTDGGKDYTKGLINFTGAGGSGAEFEVIIPPKGGHGADIYRELGTYRVMVYSKYDASSDFISQNNFSRIGIVRNPTEYGSSTAILNTSTATNLGALKLTPTGIGVTSGIIYPVNAEIRQTVGAGQTAVGYVASFNQNTGVLRYYQPVGLSTIANNAFKQFDFAGIAAPITCTDAVFNSGSQSILQPDITFAGSSINIGGKIIALGQSFTTGKANPDVEKYSGDIIYIDNRAPITRSSSQKEEVKIVVEF